jgi:hypothetical protein
MYYKIERQQNILQVDDSFAVLRTIQEDGTLNFEFQYSIKQSDAIKLSTKVEITVYTKTIPKKSILGTSDTGRIDAKKLINNILSDSTLAKTAIKQQDDYVICRKYSDVSAFINNDIVSEVRLDRPISAIQSLYRSKLKLKPAGESKESNEVQPIFNTLAIREDNVSLKLSASINEDTTRLTHDLILKRGIDPSETTSLFSDTFNSVQAFQGTFETSKRSEESFGTLKRLRDHHTLHPDLLISPEKSSSDIDGSKLFDVIVSETEDLLTIPVQISFKNQKLKLSSKESSDVFVRFDLLDQKTNAPIDTITKMLDVSKHVRFYQTPVIPPVVKQVKSEISSRVNLEIKQIDKSADSIYVYKKNISTATTDIDSYNLVGVYKVTPNQTALIQVNKPTYDAYIYRCIPAKSTNLGYSYTNVVIKPSKYKSIKSISITSYIADAGVVVEARKLPPNAVSVQFMQRNLTTFESTYTPIDKPKLIDDAAKSSDYVSAVTTNVLDNHVYEFVTNVYFRDGINEILGKEIIEYIIPTPGKVDIEINDLKITKEEDIDVTFEVKLNFVDNDIEEIKTILEKQGIKSYFDNDISKQRDQLQDLLSYSVHRINTVTGEKENFGVITDSKFSDKNNRKKRSVKPPVEGQSYRYIVTAVARAAETTFESFEKKSKDAQTKKNYVYKPSKFLHPITLKRGVLTSPAGLRTRYTKSIFEHGTLGSTTKIDVSLDKDLISVIQANVSSFDDEHHVITWQVNGDINLVDHFLIMREIHGIRTILGCAHNQFAYNSCQWIHKLGKVDRGQVRYVIVPIMNDYSKGQEVYSNTILVERFQ